MNHSIIWSMYFIIVVYNVVDTVQTIMLIKLGCEEANPYICFFIEKSGTPHVIWLIKALPIMALGLLLYHYTKNDRRHNGA